MDLDPRRHFVVATAIIKDGKYLIAKRSERAKAFPGKWTVPSMVDDIIRTRQGLARDAGGGRRGTLEVKARPSAVSFRSSHSSREPYIAPALGPRAAGTHLDPARATLIGGAFVCGILT